MRFSIGYQLPDEDDSTVDIVGDYCDNVGEVYFALPGQASGRAPLGIEQQSQQYEVAEVFQQEMAELSGMGVDLVLLLNAACYGEQAVSVALGDQVVADVKKLLGCCNLTGVTTTSPFIAGILKKAFPGLQLRASVNMRIGTVKGMAYLADSFDGYYMQREYNRDFKRITELRKFCDDNGKTLHLLANSGCLNFCSAQSFHDNLVAHEAGVRQQENVPAEYPSMCWEFLSRRKNWHIFLQNSWIRPEDIRHDQGLFETVKLATRMHSRPRQVIGAYASEKFHGNLLDLTEPGYGTVFKGYYIDNDRFPADWFEKTVSCQKNCDQCAYCKSVLEKVLVKASDIDVYTQTN